jgi:hypothetical protein
MHRRLIEHARRPRTEALRDHGRLLALLRRAKNEHMLGPEPIDLSGKLAQRALAEHNAHGQTVKDKVFEHPSSSTRRFCLHCTITPRRYAC